MREQERDNPEAQKQYSFEEWSRRLKDDYGWNDDTTGWIGWRRIEEDWLVSARDNESYQQKAFHFCRASWERSGTIIGLDEQCKCGEYVPEGVRMVALLLEAL